MARRARSKFVEDALLSASARYGVPFHILNSIAQIESGGNPTASAGSYRGLFQLSQSEFERMGGSGDILDPRANAMAGAALLASHMSAYEKKFGKQPSLPELYMIHQQGWGGFLNHMANPDRPAWENMAATAEGRARGPDWAKQAVRGNIPRQFLQGRDPDSITSGEFFDIWNRRIQGEAPEQVAQTPTGTLGVEHEAGVNLSRGITPQAAGRPGSRQPAEIPERQEPGFFDRQYPIVHALTGKDEPIGRQLLGGLFGEPGLATNRTTGNVGAGLRELGKGIASAASSRPPQLAASAASTPALPVEQQDERAFALPQPPRRRLYGG